MRSNEFVRIFLSDDEAGQKVLGLIVPLLAAIGIIILLTTLVPLLFGRKEPELGKYGISGGAVCPKCGLPFPIHFFSMHVGASKFERCPHCGKRAWVRKAKAEDLRSAEGRWRGDQSAPAREDGDERLCRQIDDSRYEK